MSKLTFARVTRSGACAACGAYGGSSHRPTCEPGRRIQLQSNWSILRDSRLSATVRDYMKYERWLIRHC
jgi:hypothetical protein